MSQTLELNEEELEESLLWTDEEDQDTQEIDSNDEELLLSEPPRNLAVAVCMSLKTAQNGLTARNGTSISKSLETTVLEDITITENNSSIIHNTTTPSDEVNLDITLGTRDIFDDSVLCDATQSILNISHISVDKVNSTYHWQDGDVVIAMSNISQLAGVCNDKITKTVAPVTQDELKKHILPEVVISEQNVISDNEDVNKSIIVEDITIGSFTTNNDNPPDNFLIPKRVIESTDSDDQVPQPKRSKTTSCSSPTSPSLNISIRSRHQSAPQPSNDPPSDSPLHNGPAPESKAVIKHVHESKPATKSSPESENATKLTHESETATKPPLDLETSTKPPPELETATKPPPESKTATKSEITSSVSEAHVQNTESDNLVSTECNRVASPNPESQDNSQLVSLNYSNYFKDSSPFVCRVCSKRIENSKTFEEHIVSNHAMRIIMKDFTVRYHDHYITHADSKKILSSRVNPNLRLTFIKDPEVVKDFKSNIEHKAGKFYCTRCENIYTNESLIMEHIRGKKHKKTCSNPSV